MLDDDTVIVAHRRRRDHRLPKHATPSSSTPTGFTKAADAGRRSSNLTTGFVFVDLDGLIPFIEGLAGPDSVPRTTRATSLESLDSFILSGSSDGDLLRSAASSASTAGVSRPRRDAAPRRTTLRTRGDRRLD